MLVTSLWLHACTLLHEYTTLVEMVFDNLEINWVTHKQWHFHTQQSIIISTQVSSSSRCLPEVVGIPTCILYNKPYSKNACIGYWPTDENETVGAAIHLFRCREVWHFVTTRLYTHAHCALLATTGDTALVVQ